MALSDFWNGTKHRARAERLQQELKASQSSVDELRKRCVVLEGQLQQSGLLSLDEIKDLVKIEGDRLAQTKVHLAATQAEVDAAFRNLKDIQKAILVAEDTVVHAAAAEQYRESLRMVMPAESIQATELAVTADADT